MKNTPLAADPQNRHELGQAPAARKFMTVGGEPPIPYGASSAQHTGFTRRAATKQIQSDLVGGLRRYSCHQSDSSLDNSAMRRANSGCIGEPSSRWRNMTRTDWTLLVERRGTGVLVVHDGPELALEARVGQPHARAARHLGPRVPMRGRFGLDCQALSLVVALDRAALMGAGRSLSNVSSESPARQPGGDGRMPAPCPARATGFSRARAALLRGERER